MTNKHIDLQIGDKVGMASPSSLITNELKNQFDVGVTNLKEFGLQVKIGPSRLTLDDI